MPIVGYAPQSRSMTALDTSLSLTPVGTSSVPLTPVGTTPSMASGGPIGAPIGAPMGGGPIGPMSSMGSFSGPPGAPPPSPSLYQICCTLRERFESIPGLEPYVAACYEQAQNTPAVFLNPDAGLDAVSFVWTFVRLGASLCALFNILGPSTILKSDIPVDVKAAKRAVYDFVQGLKAELGYHDDELFTISDVFSDSTGDLMKVLKTVQLLLAYMEDRKLIMPPMPPQPPRAPSCRRDRVVEELVSTEQKYVHDLEVLIDYRNRVQKMGLVSVDTLHALFPNLTNLVDFQRRLLVGIEHNASLPPEKQRFGVLFESLEDAFEVYKGYSLHQHQACDLALEAAPRLAPLSHVVEPTYELPAMLIKPIQRICKYPLLFRELIKATPEEWPYQSELYDGMESIERVTQSVNESKRKLDNAESVRDLQERLRDWRGHNLADFGELLHEGVFPVVKAGLEREYHLYLFENIILCCKESSNSMMSKKGINLSKKRPSVSGSAASSQSDTARSSLVLKGRIYMAYISSVSVSRRDGGFLLHLAWGKDDTDMGFFEIRFRNEELLGQWESTIRSMVARYENGNLTANGSSQSRDSDGYYSAKPAYLSGGSGGSVSTQAPSQQSSQQLQQQPTPLSSTASLPGLVNSQQGRTRSASTPSFGIVTPTSSGEAPPLPTNSQQIAQKAARIKSESAAPSSSSSLLSERQQQWGGSQVTMGGGERPSQIRVKLHYLEDTFLIMVPEGISYPQLVERIERKIRLCGKDTPCPLRLKYKDEDDDFVTITSDEDIQMAREIRMDSSDPRTTPLTIWIA
uniref:ARAD1A02662p n=1 Tax=Blastobotrys adeninivorans TaxID=409370 RepID=A0A060T2M6_BLAAD